MVFSAEMRQDIGTDCHALHLPYVDTLQLWTYVHSPSPHCNITGGMHVVLLPFNRHHIWSVAWSVRNEHELMSGDAHGQVSCCPLPLPVSAIDLHHATDILLTKGSVVTHASKS